MYHYNFATFIVISLNPYIITNYKIMNINIVIYHMNSQDHPFQMEGKVNLH